jgi:hypothetical protein
MISCKIAGTKFSPFFFLCFFSAKINFSLNYWFHFYCTFHSMTSFVLHQSSEIQFSEQILHILKPLIVFSCNLLNCTDVFFLLFITFCRKKWIKSILYCLFRLSMQNFIFRNFLLPIVCKCKQIFIWMIDIKSLSGSFF